MLLGYLQVLNNNNNLYIYIFARFKLTSVRECSEFSEELPICFIATSDASTATSPSYINKKGISTICNNVSYL